jgi:FKBP-type peptidyl-prolyl cis-trans isomerase
VRIRGITTGLAQRSALPQQVPTLVELGFDRTKSRVLVVSADLAALKLAAQILLLGDQLVDPGQGVVVFCHPSSVPATVITVTDKPEIDFPAGPAPTQLVVEDIVVGDGAEAVPGGTVEVHYVGVEYDTGEEFDSSWSRNASIEFPLRGLIQGWQDGIPGMRVGAGASSPFRRNRRTVPRARRTGCPARR